MRFFFFKEGVVYILPEKLQEISSTPVTKAVQGLNDVTSWLESIYMAHVKLYLTSIGIMIDCHK